MPQIIITPTAAQGLEQSRLFLFKKDPLAARRAAKTIKHHLLMLCEHPEMGRPDGEQPMLRELVIEFGDSGYVALYQFDITQDIVFVLTIRHQKKLIKKFGHDQISTTFL